MQKTHKIKWRKEDKEELAREVRRFNAKRTRLIKKNPAYAEYLPDKLSVKELKSNISTRKEFNRTLNSVKRFMRKGAETPIETKGGVKTTKYEKKELGLKLRLVNQRRTIERKKANVSTEKGTMGSIRANNLMPKKANLDLISKEGWKKFAESVDKQSKDSYFYGKQERYKQNYLSSIKNTFGNKGDDLFKLVDSVPAEIVVQAFYDDPFLNIDFFYSPYEMAIKIEALMDHWNMYLD